MLLSSREAVTPCCPCFVSFQLPPFPRDDPRDLLPVLLEFDVKGLVAKNGVLFSNKYDPLPHLTPILSLSLTLTLKLPYSLSQFPNFHPTISLPLPVAPLLLHQWLFLSLPFCPWSRLLSLSAISCIISAYRGSGWKWNMAAKPRRVCSYSV